MLQQLTVDVRSCFPAVLTRKYGCDVAVVGLLRARTLGNSYGHRFTDHEALKSLMNTPPSIWEARQVGDGAARARPAN